jgi:4'-phosphopantetheinyl transferase
MPFARSASLVHGRYPQHYVPMMASLAQLTSGLADRLHDYEIHVWEMAYSPSARRGPLHAVLAAYMGVDAGLITLGQNEHGKPALEPTHASAIDFNWSHSSDRALIAIGRDVSLGIDVERLRERPRALEIAERYFSPDETDMLRAQPVENRSAAFLELWTAKEAVLKALGRGIAFGLHRLSIAIECDHLAIQQLDGENLDAWHLHRLTVDESSVAALAWRGGPREIRRFDLPAVLDGRTVPG